MDVSYGLTRRLTDTSLSQARERITKALKDEGFGVLTEIDVQATLKKKINVDFKPYVILGACNPDLAHRALSRHPGIGLLLPCNVVLTQTDDGSAEVSIMKPEVLFRLVEDRELETMAAEATAKLSRALEKM
jgi:uncharacterized protein (DUF302 family)